MSAAPDNLAAAVGHEAAAELNDALRKIAHCLGQLTEEQLWSRPAESMNSMANLMLHLSGNVRQWIVAGVGGTADTRNRPEEFSAQGPIPQAQLRSVLDETVAAATAVLRAVSTEDLLGPRRIQGFDVTGLQAIIESVAHFRGHTQEIVHLTRRQLGEHYAYDFVPTSPEQGAPVD